MPPLIVVEGSTDAMQAVAADATSAGWRVLPGWRIPPDADADLILAGPVTDGAEARDAILAAVAGCGVIVHAVGDRDAIDMLCEDLRHLGPLDHRIGDDPGGRLTPDDRGVLGLLAEGMTLGQAASRLHLSRRSADRRLASARAALGVGTSAEAVLAYRERLDRIGRPPGRRGASATTW